MQNDQEVWKNVVGYEGLYQVSNKGVVKSVERMVFVSRKGCPYHRMQRERLLKPALVEGYRRVDLSKDGKSKSFFVHILLMEAFVGPCPEGMQCRHLDGDKLNNHLSNLRWGTQLENMQDRENQGRTVRGSRKNNAKFHESDIPKIIDLWNAGFTGPEIGGLYNCNRSTIYKIVYRQTWKHVDK